uniref:MotA/TolQ/ExbB proton channel family protein n=1 Tax=Candidatus Kentrum sp. TUN TaxID=2126343 RepID=A0A451A822_9GAMM|nr:MAG: MotA/TolQ/ExbB proton channel family protein [Candidatus Kentron sp. TUN]VFK58213.1 MAG: MotA/TolQ/ExbB proton channel family protein [Candidatus Kentron sp. TUN]VFK62171.1 MAG: MotA/TolQ/ExbB proton channel family protein [Candidatus Kentron sp. TUN]
MSDLVKNFIVLIASIIVVHLIYMGYVRPEANLLLEMASAAGQSAPRDLVVILKDIEQEICFVLMLWGVYLIASKSLAILNDKHVFSVDLIAEASDAPEDIVSNPEKIIRRLDEELLQGQARPTPLIRMLHAVLQRYAAMQGLQSFNVQNLSDAIESGIEALDRRQEAENSMIRYLIWAIPSIGFIGTVRGIGQALSLADEALAGNIAGMTDSLGVAFNSTLVALLISILLMFLFHQLQRLQDGQVVDTRAYFDKYLLAPVSRSLSKF